MFGNGLIEMCPLRPIMHKTRFSASDEVTALMNVDVVTVESDDPLFVAAEKMHRNGVGGLPVTDTEGNLVGMLTERDICRAASENGGDLTDDIVRDWMVAPAVAVQAEETINGVIQRMGDYNYRRMPVVRGTKLVGIVSQTDMMKNYPDLVCSRDW